MAKEYDDAAIEQLAQEQLGLNENPDTAGQQLMEDFQESAPFDPPPTIEVAVAAPKKRRSGKNQREKAQLYQAVDVLSQQLDQIKFENEQLRAQNAYKDRLTATYVDDSLESRSEQAKFILKSAIEEGDIDRQADAQQVIAQLQAERAMLKATANQPKAQLPRYERQYIPSEPPVTALNEDYEDFLEECPWADPNSTHYEETLHDEVSQLADYMRRSLTLSGDMGIIGKKPFYDTLRDAIRSKYGIGDSYVYQSPAPRTPNYRPRTLAPVNNMNNPYNSNGYNPMSRSRNPADHLTQSEREIAHNLPLYDGQGRPRSDAEKRDHYAKAKMAELQRQQQSGRR